MSDRTRWIHHDRNGRRREGEDAPGDDLPEGVLHLVGVGTASTIVDGVLYVDGKRAAPGQRRFAFRDADLPVSIKAGGRAERKPKELRGGGQGGRRN